MHPLVSVVFMFSPAICPMCGSCCVRTGRSRIHRCSLKAIKEQLTGRMWVVNRGKQGRAEDTVTLSTPHIHEHSHSVIFSTQHFLWLCTYSNEPSPSALPAHVSHPCDLSVWWTCPAITHFSLCCSPYLFVWHLISHSLPLFVHFFGLSHLGLSISFDSCSLFGTKFTLMNRKASMKATQVPVHWRTVCGLWVTESEKNEDHWVGIVAL